MNEKSIKYNRHNHDYDCYLDGEYVGSRATFHDAEVMLDELIYERLRRAVDRAEWLVCDQPERQAA